jgi:hypothetical protein
LAEQLGALVGVQPRFSGAEQPTALLSDARRCLGRFGPPRVGLEEMIRWIVDWVGAGRRTLKKPTKFDVRDGRF